MKTVTESYSIIIDTNKYAGNFERQLCAYATGVIGDCGVGSEEANEYKKSGMPNLEDFVDQVPDEHGCFRPVQICPTPGYFNNGMGYHYKSNNVREKQNAVKTYKRSIKECNEPRIEQIEKRISSQDWSYGWTLDACNREIRQRKKEIEAANALKEPPEYPAYQSVEIFFTEKPSQKILELIEKRAREYCEKHKIKVIGVR